MSHPLEKCSFLLLLSSMVLQPGTVEGWREKVGEGGRQRRKKWRERDREGRRWGRGRDGGESGGGGETEKGEGGRGGETEKGEGEGRKTGREEMKGEGEEEGREVKQPKWVRVPTSFWIQADDTYSKHHLSIFVFLNWKADSNISSVGCGGRELVKKQQKPFVLTSLKPGQHRPSESPACPCETE